MDRTTVWKLRLVEVAVEVETPGGSPRVDIGDIKAKRICMYLFMYRTYSRQVDRTVGSKK